MSDLITTYGLTPLEAAFVGEYTSNGMKRSKAARKVGCGVSVYSRPQVQAALNDYGRMVVEESKIKMIAILDNLNDIATLNHDDVYDIDEYGKKKLKPNLDREVMSCIKNMKTDKDGNLDIEFYDKYGATDRLAKFFDWYQEQALINIDMTNKSDQPLDIKEASRRLAFQMAVAAKQIENDKDKVIENGDS